MIRLIELFAGVGSQAMAMRNIGVDFEHYKVVEFDKYAIDSYNAIHGTNFETSNITQIHTEDLEIIDTKSFTYLLTYSFPCQDLSVAGERKGMTKGDGTRSGLLWEVERILDECEELPQILVMENVPMVHGVDNIEDFNKWQLFLMKKGYRNFWQDLNAKDYGIPQSRNRCFMVSFLDRDYYNFPKPFKLEKCVKDFLEEKVDEKYYVNTQKVQQLIQKLEDADFEEINTGVIKNVVSLKEELEPSFEKKDVGTAITARVYKGFNNHGTNAVLEKINVVGNIFDEDNETHANGRVYDENGIMATLGSSNFGRERYVVTTKGKKQEVASTILSGYYKDNMTGFNSTNAVVEKIPIPNGTDKGFIECENGGVFNHQRINDDNSRGRVIDGGKVAPTIQASNEICQVKMEKSNLRIRKLTPRECWRLMAFTDEDFDKAAKVVSNSQLYKQAGNSICVNVLEELFKEIFMPKYNEQKGQLTFF